LALYKKADASGHLFIFIITTNELLWPDSYLHYIKIRL